MTSVYRGFNVPDGSDPPDGPGDFRRFADTISAQTVLGSSQGEILKASGLTSATIVSSTTWATLATAGTTVNVSAMGLVLVKALVDVQVQEFGQQVTLAGGSFMARIIGHTASQVTMFERAGRVELTPTALLICAAGTLTLGLEAQIAVAAGFQVNSVKWSVFSTGGVT